MGLNNIYYPQEFPNSYSNLLLLIYISLSTLLPSQPTLALFGYRALYPEKIGNDIDIACLVPCSRREDIFNNFFHFAVNLQHALQKEDNRVIVIINAENYQLQLSLEGVRIDLSFTNDFYKQIDNAPFNLCGFRLLTIYTHTAEIICQHTVYTKASQNDLETHSLTAIDDSIFTTHASCDTDQRKFFLFVLKSLSRVKCCNDKLCKLLLELANDVEAKLPVSGPDNKPFFQQYLGVYKGPCLSFLKGAEIPPPKISALLTP